MGGLFQGGPPTLKDPTPAPTGRLATILSDGNAPPPSDDTPPLPLTPPTTTASDAAPLFKPGDQLAQVSSSPRQTPPEVRDNTNEPLPLPPTPRPFEALRPEKEAETEDQITNIVFNETRSLSGPGIDATRRKMALTIMNAVDRWPGPTNIRSKRAGTAPNTIPDNLSRQEQAILEEVRVAVHGAASVKGLGGDEVDGATNYNLRPFIKGRAPSLKPPSWGPRLHSPLIFGPFSDSYKGESKYIYIWHYPDGER